MPKVVLSLLDRLLRTADLETRSNFVSLNTFKDRLRHDLEYLLNTSKPLSPEDSSIRGTILDFGLPEFVGIDIADANAQTRLAVAIEQTLRAFEPRLTNISVVPLLASVGKEENERAINSSQPTFRVRAELRYSPAREKIRFHALLDGATGRLRPGEITEDA